MSNNDSALEARPRRSHFDWLLPALTRPGPALARALEQPNDTWLTPILVLMLTGLGHALAAGWVRAANPPVMSLPEQFQYWSPDQQAQFMQAQAATQGFISRVGIHFWLTADGKFLDIVGPVNPKSDFVKSEGRTS